MYGIALAALGMLSRIATGLVIDVSGGIAEMVGMSHIIRERTDALDAAGNTTAAIGKVPKDSLLRHSFLFVLFPFEEGNRQGQIYKVFL